MSIRARATAGFCLGLVLLSGCGTSATKSEPEATVEQVDTSGNQDPKMGPVLVRTIDADDIEMITIKFCDGTTLVYNFVGFRKGGGDTIQNSPECGAPAPEPTM